MGTGFGALEKAIHELRGPGFQDRVLAAIAEGPVRGPQTAGPETNGDQERAEHRPGIARCLAALGHALPKKLIEYRQLIKLKGTYVDVLPTLVNQKTDRIHTSFNQTAAETGG